MELHLNWRPLCFGRFCWCFCIICLIAKALKSVGKNLSKTVLNKLRNGKLVVTARLAKRDFEFRAESTKQFNHEEHEGRTSKRLGVLRGKLVVTGYLSAYIPNS